MCSGEQTGKTYKRSSPFHLSVRGHTASFRLSYKEFIRSVTRAAFFDIVWLSCILYYLLKQRCFFTLGWAHHCPHNSRLAFLRDYGKKETIVAERSLPSPTIAWPVIVHFIMKAIYNLQGKRRVLGQLRPIADDWTIADDRERNLLQVVVAHFMTGFLISQVTYNSDLSISKGEKNQQF